MGCAMIKIRYRDPNELSPGLHAVAERHGRSTTVYLLPGLSAAQRSAALRRLKISARRGYDPKLPAPQLAVALAADRIRTTVGWAGAVFRSHPAGSTVPVMVVSAGAIAFLALSAVSIQVIHAPPRSAGHVFVGAPGPAASFTGGTGGTGPGTSAGPIAAGLGGDPPGQAGSVAGLPGQPGSGTGPGGRNGQNRNGQDGNGQDGNGQDGNGNANGSSNGAGPSGGTSQGADPDASSGGGTTLTGGAVPTPTPAANPTNGATAASSSDPAAPTASATTSKPSPTPTASKSGLCVNVGSLGLCV
jgi:hypothetical protein